MRRLNLLNAASILGTLLLFSPAAGAQNCQNYFPDPKTFPFFSTLGGALYKTVFTITQADGTVDPPFTLTAPMPTSGPGSVMWDNPRNYANGVFGSQADKLFQSCSGIFPSAAPQSVSFTSGGGAFAVTNTVSSAAGVMNITEQGTIIVTNLDGACPFNCLLDQGGYTKTYVYDIQHGTYTIHAKSSEHTIFIDPKGVMTDAVDTFDGASSGTWPLVVSCARVDTAVFPFAGGKKSKNGLPTAMLATFSPSTADAPISLMEAASTCGVKGFDWQQIVTNLPIPFDDSQGKPLSTPFSDPPEAGYTYMLEDPIDYASFLPPDQTFPFYYNPTIVPTGCAIGLGGGICSLPITSSNGRTLNFFDSPRSSRLPAEAHFGFKTSLVGVTANDAEGQTFFRWTWISTYNETTGGVQIQTASSIPVDGTGTGGVTILSINGVPQTGDINGDGVVNCADLDIVKASFGKKAGQNGFDMRADVNDDGVVDILDLSFVARQLPAGTLCK
jgi:hypothetical protein